MKLAARLVFLAGALGLGFFLFRAVPRDVTLVYDLGSPAPGGPGGAPARRIEVEIARAGEVVRRAELRLPPGETRAVHRVRLTDGDYHLGLNLTGPEGTRRLERDVRVSESGTIVLPLGQR